MTADPELDWSPTLKWCRDHMHGSYKGCPHCEIERLQAAIAPLRRVTPKDIAHLSGDDGHYGVVIYDAGITRETFRNLLEALSDDR